MSFPSSPKVAIAGATGFIGQALISRLLPDVQVVGLCRRPPKASSSPKLQWAKCDLYSIADLEAALSGCDVAVYLVHSMMPKDRLTQARFEDLDVILADNFARAAKQAQVKAMVYLGGLIPSSEELQGKKLSLHLASRKEVEDALASTGIPVTTLRAGLVVGPQGSSFQMLTNLVRRLPVMLCPSWTQTRTQPIALDDVLTLLTHVVKNPELQTTAFSIGGPDILTYKQMMQDVADSLGKKRWLIPVPLFSPGLSRLWVSLVTGFSRALVAPLIKSLRHPMVAHERILQERIGLPGIPWKTALASALKSEPVSAPRHRPPPNEESTVKSVQRLQRPAHLNATDIARSYVRFLQNVAPLFLRVSVQQTKTAMFLPFMKKPLLELTSVSTSDETRAVFNVTGGLLWKPSPRPAELEFRLTPTGQNVLVAIHDFVPRLPWYLYRYTQAVVHVVVSRWFEKWLSSTPV